MTVLIYPLPYIYLPFLDTLLVYINLTLSEDSSSFDPEAFKAALASYLGISEDRIDILSSGPGSNTSTTVVSIHLLEKSGEESSQSVADSLIQKVQTNDPSLVASGLNVQSASVSYVPSGDASAVQSSSGFDIMKPAILGGIIGGGALLLAIIAVVAIVVIRKRRNSGYGGSSSYPSSYPPVSSFVNKFYLFVVY
jgi:hypothetical protein